MFTISSSFHIPTAVWSKLWFLGGCFFSSAGCDPGKLPGCAEGRLLESQRGLGKSVEEASDRIKQDMEEWISRRDETWYQKNPVCRDNVYNSALFVLAAAPTITCLCTSQTTGRLVFWPFLMMMWALFYFLHITHEHHTDELALNHRV